MKSYLDGWLNLFSFAGRSDRREYWAFKGIDSAITIALVLASSGKPTLAYLTVAYIFVSMIPLWAVTIRRFHDIDHSGWWVFVPFYNLYCLCIAGTKGPNRFGSLRRF